ncbi:unnamed protein product [Alternaria alternata]
MGSSINDDSDGDAVTVYESAGPDTKDDTVPARMTISSLPKDEQLTMNASDTTNENDTVALLPATASHISSRVISKFIISTPIASTSDTEEEDM